MSGCPDSGRYPAEPPQPPVRLRRLYRAAGRTAERRAGQRQRQRQGQIFGMGQRARQRGRQPASSPWSSRLSPPGARRRGPRRPGPVRRPPRRRPPRLPRPSRHGHRAPGDRVRSRRGRVPGCDARGDLRPVDGSRDLAARHHRGRPVLWYRLHDELIIRRGRPVRVAMLPSRRGVLLPLFRSSRAIRRNRGRLHGLPVVRRPRHQPRPAPGPQLVGGRPAPPPPGIPGP